MNNNPAKIELGFTNTGAKIISHNDLFETKKYTKYLCGHVFRIGTELKNQKNSSLHYSGFIHMAKNPEEFQYFDVLGTAIRGIAGKHNAPKPLTIIITGFTKFDGVPDNASSRFLFNDGASENYGLMAADFNKIDSMMLNKFGEPEEVSEFFLTEQNATKNKIGYSYRYRDFALINLVFLRLPVDDWLESTETSQKKLSDGSFVTNYPGDHTGDLLKKSIAQLKPQALISFGVGTNGVNDFYLERISYGMVEKGAVYASQAEFVVNEDLSEIFQKQLA